MRVQLLLLIWGGIKYELRIENLTEGQVIKNYRELCRVLGIEAKSGNTKKGQIKDLECRVKYYKQGNGFIITKIYEHPLEKMAITQFMLNMLISYYYICVAKPTTVNITI